MKIETKTIVDFLKLVQMRVIETCKLSFDEDGVNAWVLDPSTTYMCYAHLSKDAFTDYQPVGSVGVDALSSLIKIFNKLGKELEFDVEGNLLTVKSKNRELYYELVADKFIEDVDDKRGNLNHDTEFKVDAKEINDFLNDVSINKDVSIIIETVDDGLKLTNTGKFKFKYNIEAKGAKKGSKVKMGAPFVDVMTGIKEGEVTLHMSTDYPLKVDYESDKYKTEFLIAPRVDNK